jgi:hypothetical protein
MLSGLHENARTAFDWSVGASRGQRKTPFRVDWEFRSGANAFPNSYDVSDPELVRIIPSENFYAGASYPFRRVRFREDIEREDVITGEANLKRSMMIGTRNAFWKTGVKVVTRDKLQDCTNDNYNAGAQAFTLADFGLGNVVDRFFFDELRFGPTLNLPGLKDFFAANPSRFAFDDVTTAQNSVEQDFSAEERVIAGYGMVHVDFARGNLMAGVRLEATRADYAATELIFANALFTGRTIPATGSTDYLHALPTRFVSRRDAAD